MFTEALDLHREYPVVDGHADSVLQVLDGKRTLVDRSDLGHLDFHRAREARLACTVQALWLDPVFYSAAPQRVAMLTDSLLQQVEKAGPTVRLARSARDIREAHGAGNLAVLVNIEGAEGIRGSLALLRNFYRLGVRMMGLVWNHRNEVADGIAEGESGGGLSQFGRTVVAEMNRLGMLIDLAHITPQGFFEVLEVSQHPVLFTHGNCRSLWDHPRNLTDQQIKALAAHGGVFGISFVAPFMGTKSDELSVETVADHIDHAVQLLGSASHVGIGSDFDGADCVPGLDDVTRFPALTAELLRRGYKKSDVANILGGNYLRIFEQVLGC